MHAASAAVCLITVVHSEGVIGRRVPGYLSQAER
jgi:hypothetical protein